MNIGKYNIKEERIRISHHPNPFTIRANPGWTIAYTPFIFFKAVLADHKPTGTTPAKLLFFLAAVTNIFSNPSFSVTSFFRLRHRSPLREASSDIPLNTTVEILLQFQQPRTDELTVFFLLLEEQNR